MNPEKILELAAELKVLKFFPSEPAALNAIVRMLGDMCETEEQVRWLIRRMTSGIYADWPGVKELRACYCSRFRPKDGINAYSAVYPDGLPLSSEAQKAQLAAGKAQKTLPPGAEISAAASVENAVRDLARVKDMNFSGRAKVREIPSLPPGVKPVTEADIALAVAEHRRKKQAERDRVAAADIATPEAI